MQLLSKISDAGYGLAAVHDGISSILKGIGIIFGPCELLERNDHT